MTLLELDGVTKVLRRRGPDRVVLRDVSLAVAEGGFVGILGAPHSGKTMLLRIASGHELPDAGSIRFAGHDVYAMKPRQREDLIASGIAFACNLPPPPGLSVSLFVHMSYNGWNWRQSVRHEVDDLLDALGLLELADASWNELTGDEQRRVALAQGLIRRPRLLLIDDLLLGADLVLREQVLGLLRSQMREHGITIVMTASEPTHLLRCDEMMALTDGELIKPTARASAEVIELPSRRRRPA
jgi:ABC-type multidrug transport system ATPase subunit